MLDSLDFASSDSSSTRFARLLDAAARNARPLTGTDYEQHCNVINIYQGAHTHLGGARNTPFVIPSPVKYETFFASGCRNKRA